MPSPSLSSAVAYAQDKLNELNLDKLKSLDLHRNLFEQYLVGVYPPLKTMEPITEEDVLSNASGLYNIYAHVPFCEQYCTFCHFYKDINPKADKVYTYLETTKKKLDIISDKIGEIRGKTLFFGGGTPSFLNGEQIHIMANSIKSKVTFEPGSEVTFELHPQIVHKPDCDDRFQAMLDSGVNRWVSGVQSMDNKVLNKLNRGHSDIEVFMLLEVMKKHGCDNLSLDLIYGLPYQTIENWYDTIVTLVDAGVTKFNVFPLMFKVSDPITLHYLKSPEIFPDDETRLIMHYMAEFILRDQGYNSGPVLYYSKSGTHSAQQESKFDEAEVTNLLPLGVGTFGHIGHTQYYNYCDMGKYTEAIESGKLPIWRGQTLSNDEQARRSIMFSLRSKGISLPEFSNNFGFDPLIKFDKEFNILLENDLLECDNGIIKTTDKGALFVDNIASLFVSDVVREKVASTNTQIIKNPKTSTLERYDFSSIGRANKSFVNNSSYDNNKAKELSD